MPEPPPTRTIVLWCPDWPVIAAARAAGVPPEQPFAVVSKGQVFASSASARQSGVVRGLRVREAQARCPELVVQPYDEGLDHRAFEPVIRAVEAAVPGVEVLRPGTVALRSRGPARYYGGERAAAATLAGIAADHGAPAVRAGVADTPFAADQAARARPVRPGERVRIVPVGGSAEFLADLPLGVLGDADLAMVLGRLGIATLGEFAAFTDEQVRDRFGVAGAFLHRLAGGRDPREISSRPVPPELRVEAAFEPPLDRADQIAFAFRRTADDFAARLRAAGLVATTIRVGIVDERDILLDRTWAHPRWFDAADVVDRVRWQLAGGVDPTGLEAPVTSVVLEPVAVDDMANHERGLWGSGPDERVHHGLARVQGMVGHDGVVTPRVGGGRTLSERVVLVPWGDAPAADLASVADRPWPGKLPGPPPATVLERPRPVDVVASDGGSVDVDDRGVLSGAPERFRAEADRGGRFAPVTAWAGPWPLVVRWWDAGGRRLHRLQLVDAEGRAWYLVLADHRWWAEAVAT
ncbi:DNA polymerase Y family protein [Curtobacterium sp. RRHDQ66]|uniref:DNA polymerase Y family protein n=1 Tax=Curtobacterium guangdongense TaxID=3413380 RepID=UPI003BEFA548